MSLPASNLRVFLVFMHTIFSVCECPRHLTCLPRHPHPRLLQVASMRVFSAAVCKVASRFVRTGTFLLYFYSPLTIPPTTCGSSCDASRAVRGLRPAMI